MTKSKQKEIDQCWEDRDEEITLSAVLEFDKDTFAKNITWVKVGGDMLPYIYTMLGGSEKILVNYPYCEIDLKAYREGDLFYQNKSLRILN